MSHRRDMEQMVKKVKKQGWTVERRPCGHLWLVAPSGERVNAPSTPSDHRSLLNVRAILRRKGAVL